MIAAYGRKRKTLLYVDPPYLASSRNGHNYRHEMGGEPEHRALAEALHDCAATVIVSGYANDVYDRELFADWYRRELPSATSQGGTWQARTEVLWSNRPLAAPTRPEPSLFAGPEFRNTSPASAEVCNETLCVAPDCQRVLRQPTTGRRRRYCSTACRVRTHRSTPAVTDQE